MLLLKRVLMAKLAEHGVELELTTGGPTMRGIDQELVREEFYQQTPADGTESPEKRFPPQASRSDHQPCHRKAADRDAGDRRGYVFLAAPQSTQQRGGLLDASECPWLAQPSDGGHFDYNQNRSVRRSVCMGLKKLAESMR